MPPLMVSSVGDHSAPTSSAISPLAYSTMRRAAGEQSRVASSHGLGVGADHGLGECQDLHATSSWFHARTTSPTDVPLLLPSVVLTACSPWPTAARQGKSHTRYLQLPYVHTYACI
jgi:hypothetical protein